METKHVVWDIYVCKNENFPNGCITLSWDGKYGFGQYDLIIDSKPYDCFNPDPNHKLKIIARSEHMDNNDHKEFIKELLLSLVDSIEIES